MKRFSALIVLFVVACSNSEAQEAPRAVVPSQPAVIAPALVAVTAVAHEPEVVKREPRRVVRKSRLEAEWMTKICVSEGGFNIVECEKLLQTLENMREARKKDKSLLLAMYTQSAKITRREPFTDTRQVWVSYLRMHGTEKPEKGWIECTGKDPKTKRPIPAGCTGWWEYTVKEWVPFRAKARELYFSGIVPETVPGYPIQWGGDMDYWRGAGRRFCPLNEGSGMRNTYWGDPKDHRNDGQCLAIDEEKVRVSKQLSAKIASGRAARRHRIPLLLKGVDSLIPGHGREAKHDPTSVD